MSQNRVVFIDRDGVINKDSPEYIKHWREFFFIPGSINAICRLNRAGFDVIVISNQSGIGRGIILPPDLAEMHRNMLGQVAAQGGRIRDIFFCPHAPEDNCACRKPRTGLIDAARRRYAIDLSRAIMVGDSAKDIECGRNAGVAKTILVKSGDFETASKKLMEKSVRPDHIADDLHDASEWIIAHAF